LVPVNTGTSDSHYTATPTSELTSIHLAPANGHSRASLPARPRSPSALARGDCPLLRYRALRPTPGSPPSALPGRSVQTDPGNPDLAPPKGPATSGHAVAAR